MGLKGLPQILSPDLLHALASMGHGDEIVLADSNFPSRSLCPESGSGAKYVSAHGHGIPALLEAILQLMPLDTYDFNAAVVMDLTSMDKGSGMKAPEVWAEYQEICDRAHGSKVNFLRMERSDFYMRAGKAYCIVATGEEAPYGNIILKKGVVVPPGRA